MFCDEEGNNVLYNINKNSFNYHTIALNAIDNHGRGGYFNYNKNLDEVTSEIKKTIKNYDMTDEDELDDDESFLGYDCPIKSVMENAGFSTHFG